MNPRLLDAMDASGWDKYVAVRRLMREGWAPPFALHMGILADFEQFIDLREQVAFILENGA